MNLFGLYLVACVLLVLAGASKMVRPADTVRALTGLIAHPQLVTTAVPLVAAGEFLLGVAALVWPVPALAAAVAASYAVFAGFVAVIRLRHGAVSSCGCFGTPDTPATWLHAVVNAGLAAASTVVALQAPTGTLADALRSQPLHGLPLVLGVAVASWLVILCFSSLARLSAVRQTLRGRPATPRDAAPAPPTAHGAPADHRARVPEGPPVLR